MLPPRDSFLIVFGSQLCDTYVLEGRGRESSNIFRLKRGRGHSSSVHFTFNMYGVESVTVLKN